MKRHGYVMVLLLIVLVIIALFGLVQCDVFYAISRASVENPTAVPLLVKNLQ